MTVSDKMEAAINDQINAELASSYLYLSMAAYCDAQGLPGFAHWFKLQVAEETQHAMRLYGYLNDRGGRVHLAAIDAPTEDFAGMTTVFEQTLAHEEKVTARINKLFELAHGEEDYATVEEMGWFLKEQVEEEANVSQILAQLKMAGDRPGNLMYIDRHMGKRA